MLKVTAFPNHCEITVRGTVAEFNEDLALIRKIATYDQDRKIWILRNPEDHKDIPAIAAALNDRERQMEMFSWA
jgi:hypothetical protein